ncbi:cobalt ECF transporter T component CbiQ [Leptolyngbya sp. 'hensonii']|uniref:cobalt ECF transporter T component CbiQ n=1 Tax=Leptolyngbya sp. 'hensonii' TaxID=1922337 RepID=UPI00094F726E|nr:cobalt ECF transporter T component CbiQ [Leptolyngbya sp. 'hensonii']OLP15875.1 cobalt ECF transporter T component CbiQ [Leptolyngbya sp. 'hensonii']
MLLHIGVLHLDIDSHHQTPWHRVTPRGRILCTLQMLFAIVLTPYGHWWTWAFYALPLLGLVLFSRITLSVLLRRMAIEFSFISTILLGTLFRGGGDVLWSWGPLTITTLGLTILGSVSCKTVLSLWTLNILTLTTSVSSLLQAMVALRTPPLLVAILASMYRYLAVLVDEFTAMRRAALARNLMAGQGYHHRLLIGNMIGILFIRTYDRGERVHQAMLSRGYTGVPFAPNSPAENRYDITAFSLTSMVVLIGQSLYLPLMSS